jgi:hypothetical protein
MKKIMTYGLLLLLMAGIATATTCNLTTAAKDYISMKNLTMPTTEWGCKNMNNKFVIGDKECWVLRERDGRTFQGVMGKLRDGNMTCFSPGRRHEPSPVVVPEPVCTKSCHDVNETKQPTICLKLCTNWSWHPLGCAGTWEWNYDYCTRAGLACQPDYNLECSKYKVVRGMNLCTAYACTKTSQSCSTSCTG